MSCLGIFRSRILSWPSRRLGFAPVEVDGCGETLGLVLTALKGMDRGTEGFPLFLSGNADSTLDLEIDWFFDCINFFELCVQ